MSTINIERIGKALDFLHKGLSPFIEREIKKEGISKEDILKKLETPTNQRLLKDLLNRPISTWDISNLINVMLKFWREIFYKTLSPDVRSFILEIRTIRNKYAHSTLYIKDFFSSDDEIYRALDTISRLLKEISAPEYKKEVDRLREEVDRRDDVDRDELPSEEQSKKPSDKNEKIIGIDLGTTNSCVAVMKGGAPQILDDREEGYGPIIPSVVSFTNHDDSEKEEVIVGKGARKDKNAIVAIKRLIGRRFDDKEVRRCVMRIPHPIVKADENDVSIEIDGEGKSPQEISAYILHTMKRIAMQHLDKVNAAVITVPAYFNNSQRQATKDAGRIAGLDVKCIINEPTAAALNYVMENWQKGSKVAVYDLGGGTFDISIIEMAEIDGKRRVEVKSINGDANLGGIDFDACIIEHIYTEFKKEHGVDLHNNEDQPALEITKSEIKYEAEEAKKRLSTASQTPIKIQPYWDGAMNLSIILTRPKLESLVGHLIARTEEPCRIAMKDASISASDIDKVILVGGQARMPKVRELVESIFGKKPEWGVDPDKAVALGAAILGGILTGSDGNLDLDFQDVTPHSLGIELKSGKMKKLINKGTTIPTKKSRIFTTGEQNQSAVTVSVYQGEIEERAINNELLGMFHLRDILPSPSGKPKIDVRFDIDADGILNVSAKDKDTGKEESIQITWGLASEEIERLREKVIASVGKVD